MTQAQSATTPPDAPARLFLPHWHSAVSAKDVLLLQDWTTEDCVIASPAFWTPKGPKAYVMQILKSVTFGLEDFVYDKEWIDGRELCLEFSARLGQVRMRGIDRITVNERGHMTKIEVFIRPANSLMVLAARVKSDLSP
jgi:hypothetical protein